MIPIDPSCCAAVLNQSPIDPSQSRVLVSIDSNTVDNFVARKIAEVQNVKHEAEKAGEDKKMVAAKDVGNRQHATAASEAHRAAIADLEKNTANIRKQREAAHKQMKEDAKRAKDAEDAEEAERKRELREAREAKRAEEERKRQEAESRKLDDLFNDDSELFEDSI